MNYPCLRCKKALSSEAIYGLHPSCFYESFGASGHLEFQDLDPRKATTSSAKKESSEIKKQKDTFYHGVYLKYSARLGSVGYILKVEELRFPELPLVEYLCNQIATLLKIEVPPYALINFNGRLAFVTRNFMQDYVGTLVHIYNYLPAGEINHNCREIIKVILAQIGKLSDVAKFIEICLFDALIGNNDRHGRNLGVIVTREVKKLAPMYDNPSCVGIEEDFFLVSDINPSGSVWTEHTRYPKPSDYVAEFRQLGYEQQVNQFIKKITTQQSELMSLVQDAILSQKRKDALIKLLQKRIREYQNA
jgi:hypothetical protein